MRANARYRSAAATLRRLAAWHVFFDLDPACPRGLPPVATVGEQAAGLIARRRAENRAAGLDAASRELMRVTGLRSFQGFTRDERDAWRRWSPFVLAVPGLSRWSAAERRALARVVRAKGGRRESDFVQLFDAHSRLTSALFSRR
jgi:hypothetical protein